MSADPEWQCAWCGARAVTHIRVSYDRVVRKHDSVVSIRGGTWRPACAYHRDTIRRLNDNMTPEKSRAIKREITRAIWSPKQGELLPPDVGRGSPQPHYRRDVNNDDVHN